jgi:hypothetical protein
VCYYDLITNNFILDKVSIMKLNKSVKSVNMALTFIVIELGPFIHLDSTYRLFKYTFGLHLGGLKLSVSSLVGAALVPEPLYCSSSSKSLIRSIIHFVAAIKRSFYWGITTSLLSTSEDLIISRAATSNLIIEFWAAFNNSALLLLLQEAPVKH